MQDSVILQLGSIASKQNSGRPKRVKHPTMVIAVCNLQDVYAPLAPKWIGWKSFEGHNSLVACHCADLSLLARACLMLRLEDAEAGLLYSQYPGILAACTAQKTA